MTFTQKLHESEEYRSLTEGAGDGVEQVAGATTPTGAQVNGTVISLEKTDVQFWLQVAQVVLLFLIWREMMRRGGG